MRDHSNRAAAAAVQRLADAIIVHASKLVNSPNNGAGLMSPNKGGFEFERAHKN